MRWFLFSVGVLLLITSFLIPISLTKNEIKSYNLNDDDDDSPHDYHSFDRPTFYCEMELSNLTKGKLIISYYNSAISGSPGMVYLSLLNETNEIVWSYEDYPPRSFGVERTVNTIDILTGDYILTIECDYISLLDLNVRYINEYSFYSIPFCCCGTPSIFLFSLFIFLISIKKKKK